VRHRLHQNSTFLFVKKSLSKEVKMGKRFFLVGLFLLIPMTVFAQIGEITYLEGRVDLNSNPAEAGQPLYKGDELSTQKGRVEVCLDGNYLRLNQYSKVVFTDLVDILFGEVYVEAETPMKIKTPQEVLSLEGEWRIEVDRYKTRKFQNPMLVDDFDKWNYRRQKELAQIAKEERRYPDYRDYWYWYWYYYWYWPPLYWHIWYPYYYCVFWYWTGWYYPYYGYYSYSYRYDRVLTTIRKDQIQKRAPSVRTIPPRESGVSSVKSAGKVYPSSHFSRPTVSRLSSASSKSLSRSPSFRSSSSPLFKSPSFSGPHSFSAPSFSRSSGLSRGSGSVRRR
jgi:hypothetical protein